MTKVACSCRGTSSLAFPIFLGFRQLAASNRLRCPRFMDQPREGPRLSKPNTSNPSRHRSMAARCTLKLTTGIEALPTGREDFALRDRLLRNSLQPQSRVLWDQTQGQHEACKTAALELLAQPVLPNVLQCNPALTACQIGRSGKFSSDYGNGTRTSRDHAVPSWAGPCPLPAPLGTFVVRDRLPHRMHSGHFW